MDCVFFAGFSSALRLKGQESLSRSYSNGGRVYSPDGLANTLSTSPGGLTGGGMLIVEGFNEYFKDWDDFEVEVEWQDVR